jgi:molybdopterin synthase catalytic subunit
MAAEGSAAFTLLLSQQPLSLSEAYAAVALPSAGAVASFVGTTRDGLSEGRAVDYLEFEAHAPLAVSVLQEVFEQAQLQCRGQLQRVHVAHLLGRAPVGAATVAIFVSSAHRAEALQGVALMIEGLKARAPIWKKEVYADGTSDWKSNCAACRAAPAAAV